MSKLKSVMDKFKQVKLSVEEEKSKKTNNYNNDLVFKPQIVNGEEKTKFKLRFLPVEESPSGKPWVKYNYHMFERPGDNKYVKCLDPCTFDPKAQNPIADLAKKLFASDNALDQEMARKYYRKPRYFTLVYIKEAPENQKELVGKVLIFEAGVKVFNKLDAAINDYDMCFWDPYKGRDFMLILKKVGKEKWANYDDSSFIGQDCPISNDEKAMELVGDSLEKLKIKDVILGKDAIKSGAQLKDLLEGGLGNNSKASEDKPAKEMLSGETVSTSVDNLDFGEKETPKQEKVVETKPVETKPVETAVIAETKESGSEISDFDITFTEADFDIK